MLNWPKENVEQPSAKLPEGNVVFNVTKQDDYFLVSVQYNDIGVYENDTKTYSTDAAKLHAEEIYANNWASLLILDRMDT